MRPSRANGVQAWSIEEERLGISPGACAITGLPAHTANTAPARIPIALMQMDFGATNARIASSLAGFRPNQSLFLLPDDTRGVALRRDAWTAPSTAGALCGTAASAPQSRRLTAGACDIFS